MPVRRRYCRNRNPNRRSWCFLAEMFRGGGAIADRGGDDSRPALFIASPVGSWRWRSPADRRPAGGSAEAYAVGMICRWPASVGQIFGVNRTEWPPSVPPPARRRPIPALGLPRRGTHNGGMDIHSDNPDHGFQFPGSFELSAMG